MFWPTSAWSPIRATRCRGTACCSSSSTSAPTPPRTSSRTSPPRRSWRARPSASRPTRAAGRTRRISATWPPSCELAPDTLPPGEKVAKVVGFYAPMLRHLHPEDFPKREKDLEHFATIAGRYRSLASLLADMALEPPTDSVGDVLAANVEEGLLTLSTIHSAKGLEWNTVFVIWLVDGRFPSYQNLHDGEEIEEERRLLYVAVTRAKEHLYLSYPIDIYDRSSGMVLGQPSRFLADLPERVLGGLQVVDEVGFR